MKISRLGLFFLGAIAALLFAGLTGLAVIYSGTFNVAASDPHTPIERWLLSTTMKQSVKSRAEEAAVSTDIPNERILAGGGEFKAMCQQCHGGPGVEPDAWTKGLMPSPPPLHEKARQWQAGELFWIIKHGLKMTAMPGFGKDHSDDSIREIAAFVNRLPDLSPQEYEAVPAGHQESSQSAVHEDAEPHSH